MIELTKRIDDPSGVVSKLVFEGDGGAIAEAVAYQYEDRGVVCFSVQSGCPVGCRFCGTGNRFIRDLSASEMLTQIDACLNVIGSREHVQVMSMSMGDPMLNWPATARTAEAVLFMGHHFYISTVGFKARSVLGEVKEMYAIRYGFGVQFSLHNTNERRRRALFRNDRLPYMSIADILSYAAELRQVGMGSSRVYFNYVATGNESDETVQWLAENLEGHHLTCSVMCDTGEMVKGDTAPARNLAERVRDASRGRVEISTFDPAGQDTVGGGCGQLLYVQERLSC